MRASRTTQRAEDRHTSGDMTVGPRASVDSPGEAKTDEDVAVRRCVPVTVGRADIPRRIEERPAPKNMKAVDGLARNGPRRVLAPFPDLAQHVKQPQVVGP